MKSSLEIYHLDSDDVSVVLQSERHVEAANWSPNGQFLVVNSGGRLFRVDLDTSNAAMTEIDTGFADQCNNDHGISPDGRTLVISDKSDGASCIYTLPISGGQPKRVTALTPSYWHGWSPDGATLAMCARRDDAFRIVTIPVTGGEERWLAGGSGHCDGPDYTPDGAWIWFNSSMGGSMQLWRVRPDGTDLEQMTDDDRVNWFPHPSPDGKHLLYLAYEGDVEGHPADCEVELRVIALDDLSPVARIPIFGGQGSINVPCWHPDGRKFAFVRYARQQDGT